MAEHRENRGISCVVCGEPIDTRLAATVTSNWRGSRRPQRQGWMHESCEAENVKARAEAGRVGLSVPVYEDHELPQEQMFGPFEPLSGYRS